MANESGAEVAEKKSRASSRHDRMNETTLFNFVSQSSMDELANVDYKKEKGVLFLKLHTGKRESYTVKMVETLAISATGENKNKLQFMKDRIDAANKLGANAKDLYGRNFPLTLNGRNKSILVPAVGTLFGIEGGMVFATYEEGKITITLNPPAPAAAAPSDAGTAKKAAK